MFGMPDVRSAPTIDDIRAMRSQILRLAAARGVSNIRVYGSVARGTANSESDIDLIVDVEPECSLIDLAGFQLDMEELLGHSVDVTTRVDSIIRRRVEEQSVLL